MSDIGWKDVAKMHEREIATLRQSLAAIHDAASWVGDGTASRPWNTDKLVELAKVVRAHAGGK
jgi:hypothetical protein